MASNMANGIEQIRKSQQSYTTALAVVTVGAISNPYSKATWSEKALIKDLLRDYEKRARPVVDGASPLVKIDGDLTVQQLKVGFGLGLVQILQLNENEQILTVSVKSLYRWTDHHLIWNPEDYENITHILIPTSKIWIPDVALYNYADERLEERRDCAARVDHNGVVDWQPMAIYKSTCPVRIKYFPYDRQSCNLRFGVWTYDTFRVNVSYYDEKENLNLREYVKSPEWELINSSVESRERKYPCCPEIYTDMLFHIKIKRQPAYYNYVLILPCFLLSSLTLVLFWLPPETPAKMVLGMNIFLAFFLLLLLLEDSIPNASSSFPLIGNYYCVNMALVTLSTFLCLIVVNLHFRGDRRVEVPHWLRKLAIQRGARLLFVNLGIPTAPEPKSPNRQQAPKTAAPVNAPGPEEIMRMYRQQFGFYPIPGMGYPDTMHPYPNYNRQNQALVNAYGDRYFPPDNSYGNSRPKSYPNQKYSALERAAPYSPADEIKGPMGYYGTPDQFSRWQDYASRRTTQDEQNKSCAFCPACAGLAAAAAAAAASSGPLPTDDEQQLAEDLNEHQSPPPLPISSYSEDPTDDIAAAWAAAISGSAPREKKLTPNMDPQNRPDAERDDDIDPISATRNHSMAPDLESFLIQCIRPGGSKVAVSAANARWNADARQVLPPSPFYQFSSPNCEDDDEDPEDISLQRWPSAGNCASNIYKSGGGDVDQRDENESGEFNEGALWRSSSGGVLDSSTKRNMFTSDVRLARRVQNLKRDVSEVVKGIRFMQRQSENKEKANKSIAEWRAVGAVLDRLFFVIYLFALGTSIIMYFPRSGDEKDEPDKGPSD
ncbi:unnamed protein product [Calicophoron daubneyi]|uniref:Uncharacterized protein n=1 Tax=Calicophoron daubneyi TaxID=300641 RepID=A0AAV2TJR2_CALDB